MPEPIRKVYEIKAAETTMEGNTFSGFANVMGCIDQGGDVVFPGFFKGAIADFLTAGFIPVGHKWDTLPVAYPTLAEERGNKFYIEAEWHTTPDAQATRTVCQERHAAGKSTGLSVGFLPNYETGVKTFRSGAALLSEVKSMSLDMTLFDVKALNAHQGFVRGLMPGGCEKLWETSIAPAPMNVLSVVTDAKSAALSALLTLKGQYLEGMEQSAVMSAISSVMSKLQTAIYRALYNVTAETIPDLTASFLPAFDEARDYVGTIVAELLTDADLAELREDAAPGYYYYSAVAERETANATGRKVLSAKDLDTERKFERAMRDVLGYSKEDAKCLTLNGFNGLLKRRDAGKETLDNREEVKEAGEIPAPDFAHNAELLRLQLALAAA